jgi:hypothetical protein
MTIPKWNEEWEKPDPLRGKRGWCRHQYATAGGAAVLLIAAFGLLVPAVPKARETERDTGRVWEHARDTLIKSAENAQE